MRGVDYSNHSGRTALIFANIINSIIPLSEKFKKGLIYSM
jgi:hypothetical protein